MIAFKVFGIEHNTALFFESLNVKLISTMPVVKMDLNEEELDDIHIKKVKPLEITIYY